MNIIEPASEHRSDRNKPERDKMGTSRVPLDEGKVDYCKIGLLNQREDLRLTVEVGVTLQ